VQADGVSINRDDEFCFFFLLSQTLPKCIKIQTEENKRKALHCSLESQKQRLFYSLFAKDFKPSTSQMDLLMSVDIPS
jgi:hypothetical protein